MPQRFNDMDTSAMTPEQFREIIADAMRSVGREFDTDEHEIRTIAMRLAKYHDQQQQDMQALQLEVAALRTDVDRILTTFRTVIWFAGVIGAIVTLLAGPVVTLLKGSSHGP